jgi:hypothetical protein
MTWLKNKSSSKNIFLVTEIKLRFYFYWQSVGTERKKIIKEEKGK